MKKPFPSRFASAAICIMVMINIFVPLSGFTRGYNAAGIPADWDVLMDDFNGRNLDLWQQSPPASAAITFGSGTKGTPGLQVSVSTNTNNINKSGIAQVKEGYLSFWINPNGVSIPDKGTTWVPGKSLAIAEIANSSTWNSMVRLYLRKTATQEYLAYLAWPINNAGDRYYDIDNAIPLINGWQQLTIGFQIDEWVGLWHNGVEKRRPFNVVHAEAFGDTVILGEIYQPENIPSGDILFDDVVFQIPRISDLWVNAEGGNDANDGFTAATAFRTIQRAANLAGPGTTVHILPGVYREQVIPGLNGTAAESIRYVAENGGGTVIIRGSGAGASLAWTQLNSNNIGLPPEVNFADVYSADLSSWNLNSAPRFVVQLNDRGQVANRFPLARGPNWTVGTDWKTHEFWWKADGGNSVTTCDPTVKIPYDCDKPNRSTNQLTDKNNETNPPGIEAGNLSTLQDLTGATLVAMDTEEGTFVYRRKIAAHDRTNGRVTLDIKSEIGEGSGIPGLGWGSKYYVEGKASLIDSPGEWWYDANRKHIYLWPRDPGSPATANIEISRLENGFNLENRSYITLEGLTIELFNGSAVHQVNSATDKSYSNTLRNLFIQYSNYGVKIQQSVDANSPPGNIINGFTVEGSEIANIDSQAIRQLDWWGNNVNPEQFNHSGVLNTTIRNSRFHDIGFRAEDDGVGLWFTYASQLRFEGNLIYNTAHNGIQLSYSVIQSPKSYGFSPGEIKTGQILIKDNTIKHACQLTADCAGLKIYGKAPDRHVFRDLLITGNVFRNIFGWSFVSEQRHIWTGGASSAVRGMGGFGLYIDNASGVHAYRNIAYNNAFAGFMFYGPWRDGDMIFYNNNAANSLYGFSLGGEIYDTHGSVNTQLVNNIMVNNEGFGLDLRYATGQTANINIDNNLYYLNGWRPLSQGGFDRAGAMVVREGNGYSLYTTLAEVQSNTQWEAHGVEGSPGFFRYDIAAHDMHNMSWPDFHLTDASSSPLDHGTSSLPASLTRLLNIFIVPDYRLGSAFDIGRYEAGFVLSASPTLRSVNPGGVAFFEVQIFPKDHPYMVTLNTVTLSDKLGVSFSPQVIEAGQKSIMTVTNSYSGSVVPGQVFGIEINASGNGFSNIARVQLLVGGTRSYLPVIRR